MIKFKHFFRKDFQKIQAPTEGIEPSTYGLEVHRAIHCAMGAVSLTISNRAYFASFTKLDN